MAIMTSSDVIKINNSEELVGVIDECIGVIPELQFFGASPVTKNTYKTLCVSALPTVGFRAPGTMREFSTPTLGNKTVELKYLDAMWILESSLADMDDWGREEAIAIQQKFHLKSALEKVASQTWYGASAIDGGFNGLKGIIGAVSDADTDDGTMVIQVDSGAITDGTSVFAVRTGLDSIQYAWGNGGRFFEGEIIKTPRINLNAGGTALEGAYYYSQELASWVGLQVTSRNAAAMITGLSAAVANKGLTDDLLYQLIEKFPAGAPPQAIFMSRRSLGQLRKSRTATNATGAPAPIPTEIEGIPIYATDAIVNNETSDSSSGS